ncbi:MAG: glycosyltransferase family A protein [Endomicrobiaceae bacterium]|nr:glycosyltransferase family A protein [Endomicrobiaceae bacterium]
MITMTTNIVSVLLSTYNREQYLKETIHSIINQTFKNIELIIIDDGSTDNTWEELLKIKKEYKKRFVNIILKKQRNQGIGLSAIKLFKLAHGDYCFFIDSDDTIKTNAISLLHNFLSHNSDYVLAVGDNEYIDNNSKIFYLDKHRNHTYDKRKAVYKTRNQSLQNIRTDINLYSSDFGKYSSLVKENYILNGFLVSTKAIEKIGGFVKDAPAYDYYLMLQLAKYSKFKYIDEVLYSYRCHNDNDFSTSKILSDRVCKTLQYELKLIKDINLKNLTTNAKTCIKNKFAQLILTSRIQNLLLK